MAEEKAIKQIEQFTENPLPQTLDTAGTSVPPTPASANNETPF